MLILFHSQRTMVQCRLSQKTVLRSFWIPSSTWQHCVSNDLSEIGGCKDTCIAGGREQSLALPKTNVADTKLHSPCRAVPWWERILADAHKKVKRHDYKVSHCGLARRGVRVITSGCRKVNGVYRKHYLRFGGKVAHPEGLKELGKKELGKGQRQVGAGAGSSGVGTSFQHEGLYHVTQGFFNGLGSNLPTFPKESRQVRAANPRVAGCGLRELCLAATDLFHNRYSIVATSASWWL